MQETPTKKNHDHTQDEWINKNTEDIARQTEYLREIRNHLLPEEEKLRYKEVQRQVTRVMTKLLVGFAFICGLWELIGWYYDRVEIENMASRYADVAHDMYHAEGNPSIALEFLIHAIELDEDNAQYRYERAYMEGMSVIRNLLNLDRPLNKEELDSAHQALAQAIFLKGLQPDKAGPYILEGQVYAALKEFDRAQSKIEKAIALEPDNAFAHVRHGTLLLEMNRVDDAEKAINKALELNDKSKWAWLWRGVLLSDKKLDYVAAREAFQKATDIDPRFELALYNLAWTWVTKTEKNYSEARRIMEKVLVLNPDYKQAYYAIGMFYGYQNNYELAHVYMDKALMIDDEFLTARKWRGIIRTEMGKYQEAVDDFNNAIRLDPMNAGLYVRRAKAYEKLNLLDEAMVDLRFAAELNPMNKRTWYTMATVFLKAGNSEGALEFYEKALELDNSYAEAYCGISDVLAIKGDLTGALESLDKAMNIAKYRKERFILKKGYLLEKLGQHDAAVMLYREARDMDDGLFDAWWAEAKLCSKMKITNDALKAVTTCLNLRPSFSEGQKLRALLIPKDRNQIL